MDSMAAKIMKFSDKVKKIKRTDVVVFTTDDGEVIEFKIESRSDKQLGALNEKYDNLKPAVPTKRLPSGKGVKIVPDEDNHEYKSKLTQITKRQFAEMALLFLADDERPDGETEEQVDQILEVELAGFVSQVVSKGLEISGLTKVEEEYDEEMTVAKND